MIVGQHETLHLKAYAQDPSQTPSQVVDTTTTLIVTSTFTSILTVAPVVGDNRAFAVTATGPGVGTIVVNESPALPSPQSINISVAAASQPDNRRVDLLLADDPV